MTELNGSISAEAHKQAIEASMPHLEDKYKTFTMGELRDWLKEQEFTEPRFGYDRIKNRLLLEVTLPDGMGHRTFTLRAILTEMEGGK